MFNIGNFLNSIKNKHEGIVESANLVTNTINELSGVAVLPENITLKPGKILIKNISAAEKSVIFTKKKIILEKIIEKTNLNLKDIVL